MKAIIVTFLFFSFFLFSCGTKEPKIAEAETLIQNLKEEGQSVGWSVTVSIDGKIIMSEGFGYGNLEQQTPVYPDKTRFRIGSISKALTAAGLGVLMRQGKIDLDAHVRKYVPDFPEKKYPITVRQVAGHVAGIRHYNGTEFLSSKYYETVEEGLDIFKNDTLLFEPGTKYRYSSYGFNLLSAVMEAASGEEFLSYMKKAVFDPLQMTQTLPEYHDSIVPFRSGYYATTEDGKDINAPYVDNSYKWAGGGFLSTTEDLVKFGNAILDNVLFSEEVTKELTTSQKTNDGKKTGYGMGFAVRETSYGRKYFGHTGGSVGGTSNLMIFPEKKMVIAATTNDSNSKVTNLDDLVEVFY
ncbi:serine hydrolase domain-containing protein [Maribellus maritimus]|uniref:serine hydrolase domain-containing protein n=1 Tax=Maribellus maritimus TaxID=2870838 RepID=UPI001EECD161|nr:serine hydrolase domain-containing protein [Maribellus maritimus]MCG6188564.1 beta-lactamase family protein [Maribellus maritimus]